MRFHRSPVLAALIVLALSSNAPSQESPPGASTGPANLSFEIPLARPLAITVEIKQAGSIKVETSDTNFADQFEFDQKLVLVDEITAREGGKTTGTRTYSVVESTYDDEVTDSAINGCVARFELGGEENSVKLTNNRVLTNRQLQYLLATTGSLGIPVALPKEMKVGELKEIALPDLALLLVNEPVEGMKAKGMLKLESFDAATGAASLAGAMEIDCTVNELDLDIALALKGSLRLDVQVYEKRVTQAVFDAKYQYSSRGEGSAEGSGTYRVKLSTEIGSKAADAARRTPKFRTKKIHAWSMGVGIKLPSHYALYERSPTAYRWVRTLDGNKGDAIVELQFLDENVGNPDLVYDKILGGIRGRNPGTIMKKAPNPFGGEEGRIYYIPKVDKEDESRLFIQTEVYLLKGKFIMYKLYGPPKAFRAALPEFEKARASLGVLRAGN